MVTKRRSKERRPLTDGCVPKKITKRVDSAAKRARNPRNESQCPNNSRMPRSEPGINDEGQQVWLKDAFTRNGERIGVGPCCLESDPCGWHQGLDRLERRGFPLSSSKYSH